MTHINSTSDGRNFGRYNRPLIFTYGRAW